MASNYRRGGSEPEENSNSPEYISDSQDEDETVSSLFKCYKLQLPI